MRGRLHVSPVVTARKRRKLRSVRSFQQRGAARRGWPGQARPPQGARRPSASVGRTTRPAQPTTTKTTTKTTPSPRPQSPPPPPLWHWRMPGDVRSPRKRREQKARGGLRGLPGAACRSVHLASLAWGLHGPDGGTWTAEASPGALGGCRGRGAELEAASGPGLGKPSPATDDAERLRALVLGRSKEARPYALNRWIERTWRSRAPYKLTFDCRTRRTSDKDIPKLRAMAPGLRPALNDARIRFTWPSGIRTASLLAGRTDFFVTVFRLRRSISLLTASCNFRSSASSRYSSERASSPGSLIRRVVPEVGNRRLLPLVSYP